MRNAKLSGWQWIGILASVVWIAVGPTYFHLSQEDDATRTARQRYHLCIQKAWSTLKAVERCNKDLREELFFARFSNWVLVGFIPVALAWFVGRGLFPLVRWVRPELQLRGGLDDANNLRALTPRQNSKATTSVDRVAATNKEEQKEPLPTAVTPATKTREGELVLLDFVLPNGRMLRDCTFSECAECGGWLTRLARVGQPGDNVGTTLTEKEVRAVWSET